MPRVAKPDFIVSPRGDTFQVKRVRIGPARRFAEVVVMIIDSNGKGRMARCLLDTGCTKSIILEEFTEKNRRTKLSKEKSTTYQTYGGKFTSSSTASVGFRMVEFENKKQTVEFEFQVDSVGKSKTSSYDMIIGTDLLWNMGINIRFRDQLIEWDDERIPMKSHGIISNPETCELVYNMHTDSPILKEAEDRQARILDADYSKVDIDAMVEELDINRDTKRLLKRTLHKFPELFGGGLGELKGVKPASIKLKSGTRPHQGRYYNLPKAYEQPAKKEIERMVAVGVLRKLSWNDDSPWAAPSFVVPKKTGDIRIVTDFRKMNEAIERHPFPLPRIIETLQKLEKFKSATALDLSQGFYTIPIDEESQKICTTILPWGKYAYQRLAMGIACAPDIFQSIMTELLGDLDNVLIYIDDILIIQREGESEEDHLKAIETVLSRLQNKGFKANLRKSFFMQKEVEYLGYQLTSEGLKPQPKKIEAMDRILPPTNNKQLKRFLGMVNFYRDIWPRRSHILAPLNDLSASTGKKKGKRPEPWKWKEEHQRAFEEAKSMLSKEATLAFPDFNKPFHLYTDASDIQLGATLVQEGKPLGFYTRKLNSAQLNYTVGEKELLGIVEGCKAFEGIIRGMDLTIHTDHLNLLYKSLPSQRMVRWRLMLEEFHPQIKHVAGIDNDAADALSRVDMKVKLFDSVEWEKPSPRMKYSDETTPAELCKVMSELNFEPDGFDEQLYPMAAEKQLADSEFPLDVATMREHQLKDKELIDMVDNHIKKFKESRYTYKVVEDVELIHDRNRILVPKSMQEAVIDWYHTMLIHPGQKRMLETISLVYTWRGLQKQVIDRCKHCKICQMSKKAGKKKYGLLPEKESELTKWKRVNVDLWGPKTIKNVNGFDYELRVMTMVDPVTGWFESTQLYGPPTAYRCQEILDNVWLARYPRPKEIGFDNGSEFKAEFVDLCNNMGIKKKPSNAWNPQSNAILERIHQVLADGLRAFDLEGTPIDLEENDPFEQYLSAVSYAIRSAFHQSHGHSPAQLVFGRDMFLPVPATIDWNSLKERKQERIRKNNIRENSKRVPHTYEKGDLVTLKKPGILRTLAIPRKGPYKVIKHHSNGSITIETAPFEQKNVNIRRVEPFYTKTP